MRHRELDPARADRSAQAAVRPLRWTPGFGRPRDLDLLPGEVDARAECLPDRLLRGEPSGVMLRRIRLGVAVGELGSGEAALA